MAKKADPKAQKGSKDKKPTKKKEAKKWTKTEVKEKLQRSVIVNQEIFAKVKKDVLGMTIITPAAITNKHNFPITLSKRILEEIVKTGEIERVASSSFGVIYGKKEIIAEKAPEAKETIQTEVKAE